jgi:hypothetical protein
MLQAMINSRSVMPDSAVRSLLGKRLKGRIRFIVVAMAGNQGYVVIH